MKKERDTSGDQKRERGMDELGNESAFEREREGDKEIERESERERGRERKREPI